MASILLQFSPFLSKETHINDLALPTHDIYLACMIGYISAWEFLLWGCG